MKKLIALLLACVMLVGVLAACGNSDKPGTNPGTSSEPPAGGYTQTYEWNVASTFGGNSMRNMEKMLKEVETRSNGRMKFNLYWSNSLISIPEVPDALKDGIADIAVIATVNYPSILTYNAEMVGMPFVGFKSAYQVLDCWEDMYEAFPNELQGEWDKIGAMPWLTWCTSGYNMFYVDKNTVVRTPSDLAGHKIMSGKTAFLKLINANGGAGMQVAPTAYYENLEKAVADGVVNTCSVVRTFGALELINASTQFYEDKASGAYFDLFYFAISKQSWDKLDPEMKQIFKDVQALNDADRLEQKRTLEDTETAYPDLNEGTNITVLTEAETQQWIDAIKPYNEEEIDAMVNTYKKDKAPEIYEWMLKWIADNVK